MNSLQSKDLIVFDLDGTLTETKSDLKPDMAKALEQLLKEKKVAVIGGGSYKQFRKQFFSHLKYSSPLLGKLFLFPVTATSFYRYDKGWKSVYIYSLSNAQKKEIRKAVKDVFEKIQYIPPKKTYGKTLEDRGSQMSYSFLGQDVVAELGTKGIRLKEKWARENHAFRLKVAGMLQKKLPDFEVHAAAFTTIDITMRGIDKAYGVRQIEKYLRIPIKRMVFIGDALYKGGNDAAAKKSGIQTIAVKGPSDTIRVIKRILIDSKA